MVINNLKYSAQLIAPNPKEIDYWVDLSEDPNGGIIKFYNGQTWDYLNRMDDQDRDIAEEIARAKAAEQQLQSNIDSEEAARIQADNQLRQSINQEIIDRQNADAQLQNSIDDVEEDVASIQLTGEDNVYTLMVGDRNAGTIDLSSYATEAQLDTKMNKAGGEFTGAVGVPNLAIMTGDEGAMVYLQSSSTEFQVRTANAGIDSMTFTVQSSVPLKLTESGIMENGVLLENKYALLIDLDDFASKDVATTSSDGLMSSTDKQSLDNLVSNTAGYQTESQVDAKIAALVDSAPETLDTINELAAALGDDPNFATTIANQIGTKADKTVASISANGLMSSTDKQKLDSVETDANHYVLPAASADTLGGVKIGSGVNVSEDGTISVDASSGTVANFNAVVSAQTLRDPEQEYITVSFTTQNTLTGATTSNAGGSTIYAANSSDMGYMTSAMYNTLMAIPTMQIVTALPASPDENTIYFVTGE